MIAACRTAFILFTAALLTPASIAASTSEPLFYHVYHSPKRLSSTVIEDSHYHHAATVAQFDGRVYVAWNGNNYNASEGQPGQVIMLRTSDDGGANWSQTRIPFVKEYRALDDLTNRGVDARPGDADDQHKIRLNGARQWQPTLTVFRGKLLMFWGQDRNADGSAMMMSELEVADDQWRSHELHFKIDGTPYLAPSAKNANVSADPTFLNIAASTARQYQRIHGAATIPVSLNVKDLPKALLTARDPSRGDNSISMPISLSGRRLVPAPSQATVLHDREGNEVLVVALILQQTDADWNNLAVKLPATLTTTDLSNWQLSIVPLGNDGADFIGDDRGGLGLISAWEPTVVNDRDGNLQMEFRVNLPPRTESGGDVRGNGMRSAGASGRFIRGGGVEWSTAHLVDYDVPAARGSMTRIGQTSRWVLAHNHSVQGSSYDDHGVPVFKNEKYEPWARQNISLFFSTRGQEDFVAGPNISASAEEAGVEVVHYPYVQMNGAAAGELLVVYSTHRRAAACRTNALRGPIESCHDSIQFIRIRELPDRDNPVIYPNDFARYERYGKGTTQDKTYRYAKNQLTLLDRASAGIETTGNQGCLNLKFKLEGDLPDDESRPVLSFGRSPDRTRIIGLAVRRNGNTQRLLLGDQPIASDIKRGAWVLSRICYDFERNMLSANGVDLPGGPGMAPRAYLGDPTLAKRQFRLPDLTFDVGGMSLESAAVVTATGAMR